MIVGAEIVSHPAVGASWEGFCVENLLACAPAQVQGYFYRTSGGAEVDLLLHWPGGRFWAIEIKRSLTPKLERGFHEACADLQLVRNPGGDRFSLRLRQGMNAFIIAYLVSIFLICMDDHSPTCPRIGGRD